MRSPLADHCLRLAGFKIFKRQGAEVFDYQVVDLLNFHQSDILLINDVIDWRLNGYFVTVVKVESACLCCRHYWAFKVEPHSYMVKVGVASDSKLLEWFHNPRDTSSPRFVSPSVTLVHVKHAVNILFFMFLRSGNT